MKERPIIFSPAMAAKVAAGTKVQTRRVMKPQPEHLQVHKHKGRVIYDAEHRMWCWKHLVLENIWDFPGNDDRRQLAAECPHGKPGSILWVRESWIEGFPTGEPGRWSCIRPTNFEGHGRAFYRADGEDPADGPQRKWRNAMFMPRWASRSTLEITDVKVERVQDISEADAVAEGVEAGPLHENDGLYWQGGKAFLDQRNPTFDPIRAINGARGAFAALWDSINGKKPGCSWAENPWVFAISFHRVGVGA